MRNRAKLQRRGLLSVSLLAASAGWAFADNIQPVALPTAPTASATPADPSIPVPTDPVAKAAFDMLDKHCARCHQAGPKLTASKQPKKGFGNVLRLEQIAGDRNRVIPGNPENSTVYLQIVKNLMPYDVQQEGDLDKPTPTAQEIAALRTWIASLGNQAATACATRAFVDEISVVDAIAGDLKSLDPNRVRNTRYMTLTNLYNACTGDREMDVYRAGATKLLNSLGRTSAVVSLQTIDANKIILRLNLDDLGWSAEDWEKLIAAYPYAVKPNAPLFDFAASQTATSLPYVRADWFAFTASRPPLYDTLANLPPTYQELTKTLGLDIEKNIANAQVKRAGFQRSGVSRQNRMIERHNIATGYFWTSYDFAGNREKQNLFDFPLGPGRGEFAFHHDGGESIYSLPNGFQGYMLNKATGEKLDRGPTSIVLDDSRIDHNVTNGISCMGCHAQGMKKEGRDEIRAQTINDRRFPKAVRDMVATLYPPVPEMEKVLDDDMKRFTDAERRAGIDPSLNLHNVEPINALSNRYEAKLDLTLAAAEYGLPKDKFNEAAKGNRELDAQARRLQQDNVPRDQFEAAYKRLVPEVADVTIIKPSGVTPAATTLTQPLTPAVDHTFDLALVADKQTYKQDDLPVFTVRAQVDCFLTLIDTDDKDRATVLFPNKFQTNNKIKGGRDFQFPDDKAPFQFRLHDPGTETVSAVCTTDAAAPDGIRHDYGKSALTSVADYQRSVERFAAQTAVTRQITVELKTPKKDASAAKTPGAAGQKKPNIPSEARAAIKLKVQ